jgi:hypothetical protein
MIDIAPLSLPGAGILSVKGIYRQLSELGSVTTLLAHCHKRNNTAEAVLHAVRQHSGAQALAPPR